MSGRIMGGNGIIKRLAIRSTEINLRNNLKLRRGKKENSLPVGNRRNIYPLNGYEEQMKVIGMIVTSE